MLTLAQLSGFLAAAVLITLAPGPDNLMVLSLGMARGARCGIAFGLGCALGCLNHTLLAALGLAALVAATPAAFEALRICGGVYLVYLGVQAWRRRDADAGAAAPGASRAESARQLFFKGFVANAINPKVIVFFLAFLPQFVSHARGQIGWQMLQLGGVFALTTALIFTLIGGFAGRIGARLAKKPGVNLWLDRLSSLVFIGIGLRLLVE